MLKERQGVRTSWATTECRSLAGLRRTFRRTPTVPALPPADQVLEALVASERSKVGVDAEPARSEVTRSLEQYLHLIHRFLRLVHHDLDTRKDTTTLHVEKDCSAYTGHAGDFCTLTSSSLKEIEAGSRVVYASDAVGTSLDTDVVLDLPGPGNNTAFGHCTLILATGVGVCNFSGGTGKFIWFHASVAVSYLGGPNFAWDGTYSFSPRD
jgi:hypothetical protein